MSITYGILRNDTETTKKIVSFAFFKKISWRLIESLDRIELIPST